MRSMFKVGVMTAAAMVIAGVSSQSVQAEDASKVMMKGDFTACDLHRQMSEVLPDECLTRSLDLGDDGMIAAPKAREIADTVAMKIQFDLNSSRLSGQAQDNLAQAAKFLKQNGGTFALVGHTDASGSAQYNQELSQNRALAVRNHLVQKLGVSASALSYGGKGETELFDASKPNSEVNRRVELIKIPN